MSRQHWLTHQWFQEWKKSCLPRDIVRGMTIGIVLLFSVVVNAGCDASLPVTQVLVPSPTSLPSRELEQTKSPVPCSETRTDVGERTPDTPDGIEQVSKSFASPGVPDQFAIFLQVGTIDTRVGEPTLPTSLRIDGYGSDDNGIYLVQFNNVVTSESKNILDETGAERLGYVPNNAFLVRMSSDQRIAVGNIEPIQWIGIYQPAYKLSSEFKALDNARTTISIQTFPGANIPSIATLLQKWGGEVVETNENELGGEIKASIDITMLPEIARITDVMWVEPWLEPAYFVN